jgi:hypothetical protein
VSQPLQHVEAFTWFDHFILSPFFRLSAHAFSRAPKRRTS